MTGTRLPQRADRFQHRSAFPRRAKGINDSRHTRFKCHLQHAERAGDVRFDEGVPRMRGEVGLVKSGGVEDHVEGVLEAASAAPAVLVAEVEEVLGVLRAAGNRRDTLREPHAHDGAGLAVGDVEVRAVPRDARRLRKRGLVQVVRVEPSLRGVAGGWSIDSDR